MLFQWASKIKIRILGVDVIGEFKALIMLSYLINEITVKYRSTINEFNINAHKGIM